MTPTARQFFVGEDGAPRSFWRAILFLAICGVFAPIAAALVIPAVAWLSPRVDGVSEAADYWAALLAFLGAHVVMVRLFDHGSWRRVALDRRAARPRTLAFGFLVGFLAIGIPIVGLIAAGSLVRAAGDGHGGVGSLVRVSALLLPAALGEELLMRGYLFSVVRRAWGPVAALAITSVLFALLHIPNPGATVTSIAFVALAGVFLGGVLLATDSLYAAWMAHFAWNWAMAAVFHVPVSGLPLEAPGYRYVDAGPEWATGGPWGPEAGVPAGLGMIGALGTLTYFHARRKRRQEISSMAEHIAVLGAGQMGNGIAHVFAQSGFDVTMIDISPDAVAKGLSTITGNLDRQIKKGTLQAADKDAILGRIKTATSMDAVAGASLVIEAVTENRDLKFKIFGDIDRLASPDAILASNTSSISITEIGAHTKRPAQVIGMHFMNPVPVMQLVEIIRGLATSDAVAEKVVSLSKAVGKTPVEARDYPGFIANRILMPMINEAVYCLMESVGTAEAIDTVMKLGMNHPMGPLALADLIGLDTCLAILEVLHDGLGDPKYRPCPLLRTYVAAGWLGRKSKRGFYNYG